MPSNRGIITFCVAATAVFSVVGALVYREVTLLGATYVGETLATTLHLSNAPPPTHYEVLGISEWADQRDIKRAWRRASLLSHPDKVGGDDNDAFLATSRAYDVLSSEPLKREYDAELRETRRQTEGVWRSAWEVGHRRLAMLKGPEGWRDIAGAAGAALSWAFSFRSIMTVMFWLAVGALVTHWLLPRVSNIVMGALLWVWFFVTCGCCKKVTPPAPRPPEEREELRRKQLSRLAGISEPTKAGGATNGTGGAAVAAGGVAGIRPRGFRKQMKAAEPFTLAERQRAGRGRGRKLAEKPERAAQSGRTAGSDVDEARRAQQAAQEGASSEWATRGGRQTAAARRRIARANAEPPAEH